MTGAMIRDWISDILPELNDEVYLGELPGTEKAMSIRVGEIRSQQIPIGGLDNATYSRFRANCILHWTRGYKTTEEQAIAVRDAIMAQHRPLIDGYHVAMINMLNFIDIGIDSQNINEWAIEFELIYNRKKED